jgi:hypothetical protein
MSVSHLKSNGNCSYCPLNWGYARPPSYLRNASQQQEAYIQHDSGSSLRDLKLILDIRNLDVFHYTDMVKLVWIGRI